MSRRLPQLLQVGSHHVRPATFADAPELARVHVMCWHETYRGLVPDDLLAAYTAENGELIWGRILNDPAAFNAAAVYLATHAGAVVGFASCGSQRSAELSAAYDGEISTVYVLKALQRRRTGAGLMHEAACDLIERGFGAASVWVLRDNAPARRFYERCGGSLIGERTDVRGDVALLEVAYGWASLVTLRENAQRLMSNE